ncbi:Gp37-like protein [uncultured Bifidobacterium sp.]|uniref:Gp37-like protein n=1 Tax=uncultured Bifidobacterium sp. TaxID=165187 RepID=UPI00258BE438|nr:hypothetical protein [uncultured Bifidobacterium sp.]
MSIIVYGSFAAGRIGLLDSPVADIEVDEAGTGTFQVQSPTRIHAGDWIAVPGTCFGGIISDVSTTSDSADITYTGKTWLGLLSDRIITPPAGQTNLVVSGDLTDVIKTLFDNAGLTGHPFLWSNDKSGVTVPSTSIDRYATCADSLTKVLSAAGGHGRVWVLCTDAGIEFHVASIENPRLITGIDSGVTLTYKSAPRPVNHLIGLGKGEGTAREIVHRYADAAGKISDKQTLTGVEERQQTYELSDKSGAELAAGVEKKLRELQTFGTATISYNGGAGMLYPGDRLTVVDPAHGVSATATISKAVYKLDNSGGESVTWTASDTTLSTPDAQPTTTTK